VRKKDAKGGRVFGPNLVPTASFGASSLPSSIAVYTAKPPPSARSTGPLGRRIEKRLGEAARSRQ